jgi:hypothetical protein
VTDSGARAHSVSFNVELGGHDLDRLLVVGSDLEFLRGVAQREGLPSHTEVRLMASILRRLLVDDQIHKVWRLMKPEPPIRLTVTATDLDTALASWPGEWIRYAWAGGLAAPNFAHTGAIFSVVPAAAAKEYANAEELIRSRGLEVQPRFRTMRLDEWLRSTCVMIQTVDDGLVGISRRTVVRYIANHKGGVHFDPNRAIQSPKPGKRRERRKLLEVALLDHGLLRVGHLSGPEFEIAAMAKSVADAWWSGTMIRAARDLAPDDFKADPRDIRFFTGDGETGWTTARHDDPPEDPFMAGLS